MKTFFTLFVFLFSVCAFAQKIHFSDTSNVWEELIPEYNAPNPALLYYYSYHFIGDTTIGSYNYKQFNFQYDNTCGCNSIIREDTFLKKVYIWNALLDSEMVLMNYDLNVGDTFTTMYNQFVVQGIDSTLINSVWHKVWIFPPIPGGIYGSSSIYVIEGIGCIQHPTYMLWNFSGCVECSQPFMYCFSNKGITPPLYPPVSFLDNVNSCSYYPTLSEKTLQKNNDNIQVYPNPVTNELVITALADINSLTIVNMFGQVIYKGEWSNNEEVRIDVANFPEGVYNTCINSNGEQANRKVVIAH